MADGSRTLEDGACDLMKIVLKAASGKQISSEENGMGVVRHMTRKDETSVFSTARELQVFDQKDKIVVFTTGCLCNYNKSIA